ncbi:N-acetylmuramoyl-L-alanine amidase family protein [Pedobacter chitinilyticus]|uniref:N-acetylmuramoyl-L-alanine amidase n=1 Tax=Pedobacter chitinilyticus TaxID=2233776 RepID=A0A443Z0X5_9SPHI|nr:N-acetylmuramoyl-L-alanine amidase [Pedobacter chitinilyticus]RWU10165.1 N-acetylmuramoyl-L-alanine amidase [Pedobacter chitinilyticus]
MKNIPLNRAKQILILLISILSLLTIDNQSFAQQYKIKTIVLDAGHGGKDGSTRGNYSTEKDVALKTALRLGKLIEETLKDVKVVYTRTEDVFIPLYERIALANNEKADLFISIHCNDMPVYPQRYISGYTRRKGKKVPIYKTRYSKSTSTRGTETFVSGSGRIDEQDEAIKRENAAIFLEENYKENYEGFDTTDPESAIILSLMKNTFRTQSLKFAKYIQDQYVAVGRINRGVQEKSLAVLARAGMPAVLTEIGFISNPTEEDYMNSEAGQIEITNCILKAIQAYKSSVEN